MRLPPPAIRWPASSGIRATLLCIRSRMTALTPFMSVATSAIIASSEGSRLVVSVWTVPLFLAPLPDVHPLFWRQIELVARLDVEGFVPRVEIADDPIDAILLRAV